MQKHTALKCKKFMAILFMVLNKHYSWRNNAGTKLNVQAGRNVTAYQNKKVFRLSLTGKL